MKGSSGENYKKYYDILKEQIGNGAFGSVYKGKEKKSNEERAIKVIELDKIRENFSYKYDPEEIEKQIQLSIDGFIKEGHPGPHSPHLPVHK